MAGERQYSEAELDAALRRAFVDGRAEFIQVDGHDMRSSFLRAGLQHGLNKGLLKRDERFDVNEDQYTSLAYSLTKEGRNHFGLAIAA